jgi:ABC-type transporter Mla maintaining outer membrane lipid asymmetry permease subunit MlaE
VGGGILKKAASKIKQVVWDEIAITHKPVHDATLGNVSMVPFTEFAKAIEYCNGYSTVIDMDYDISHETYLESMSDRMRERYEGNPLIKALMAGSGVDASQFEGGRALTGESLQGAVTKIDEEELRGIYKSVIMGMIDGSIKSYNDMVSEVLEKGYPEETSRRIIETIATNASSVAGQLRD